MTQNEVALSALITSDHCQNIWIMNESTNRQETRRGCDLQGKSLVKNQHKVVRRLNKNIQLFHF